MIVICNHAKICASRSKANNLKVCDHALTHDVDHMVEYEEHQTNCADRGCWIYSANYGDEIFCKCIPWTKDLVLPETDKEWIKEYI